MSGPKCPECGLEMIKGFPVAGGIRFDELPWCCLSCDLIVVASPVAGTGKKEAERE